MNYHQYKCMFKSGFYHKNSNIVILKIERLYDIIILD